MTADPRLAERAVPLVLTGGALAGVAAAWWFGAPEVVLLALAAAPLALLYSYRLALPALELALVARALLDGAGSPLVTGGLALAVVALAVVVLARTPGWTAPVLAVTAYLFLSAFAGSGAHGGEHTYTEALRLVSCLSVVVVTVNAPARFDLWHVARTVQLVSLAPALLAVWQLATGTGALNNGAVRSYGTLAHANSAAALFALANLATFALLLAGRRRWLDAGLLGLFLVAQISTGSIGGLVTAVVMATTYLASSAVRRADRVLLGAAGVLLGVYAATTSRVGAQRIAEYTGDSGRDTSLEWRIQAWGNVMNAWREQPVFGHGVGATQSPTILAGHIPHNEYVRILAETGVVGLALVLGLGLWLAGRLRRAREGAPAALGLAVLTGLAVNALAANTLLYSVSTYTALFVLAACWRLSRGEVPAPNGGRAVEEVRAKSPSR